MIHPDLHAPEHTCLMVPRGEPTLRSHLVLLLTKCSQPAPTVPWAEPTALLESEQVTREGAGFEPWPSEPHPTRTPRLFLFSCVRCMSLGGSLLGPWLGAGGGWLSVLQVA